MIKLFNLIKSQFPGNDINNINTYTYVLRIKTYLQKCKGKALSVFIATYILGIAIMFNILLHSIIYILHKETFNVLKSNIFTDIVPLFVLIIISFISLSSIIYKSHNCKTYDLNIHKYNPYIYIPNTIMMTLTGEQRFYILKTLKNGSYLCQTRFQMNNSVIDYNNIRYDIISQERHIIFITCEDNIFNGVDYIMKNKKTRYIQRHRKKGDLCKSKLDKYNRRHCKRYAKDHAWHFLLITYIMIPTIIIFILAIFVFLFSGINNLYFINNVMKSLL